MDTLELGTSSKDNKAQDNKDLHLDNKEEDFLNIFELNDVEASHLSLEEINKQIALLEG